jgi:hypothetical protein
MKSISKITIICFIACVTFTTLYSCKDAAKQGVKTIAKTSAKKTAKEATKKGVKAGVKQVAKKLLRKYSKHQLIMVNGLEIEAILNGFQIRIIFQEAESIMLILKTKLGGKS